MKTTLLDNLFLITSMLLTLYVFINQSGDMRARRGRFARKRNEVTFTVVGIRG
jgi:hypothetical protein